MSDIIKNSEVLEDAELDEVAGGVSIHSIDHTNPNAHAANRDRTEKKRIMRGLAADKVAAKDKAVVRNLAESKTVAEKMHVKIVNRDR